MADTKAASHVTDHPFEPKGEWWRTCLVCNLAEAAHRDSVPCKKELPDRQLSFDLDV